MPPNTPRFNHMLTCLYDEAKNDPENPYATAMLWTNFVRSYFDLDDDYISGYSSEFPPHMEWTRLHCYVKHFNAQRDPKFQMSLFGRFGSAVDDTEVGREALMGQVEEYCRWKIGEGGQKFMFGLACIGTKARLWTIGDAPENVTIDWFDAKDGEDVFTEAIRLIKEMFAASA